MVIIYANMFCILVLNYTLRPEFIAHFHSSILSSSWEVFYHGSHKHRCPIQNSMLYCVSFALGHFLKNWFELEICSSKVNNFTCSFGFPYYPERSEVLALSGPWVSIGAPELLGVSHFGQSINFLVVTVAIARIDFSFPGWIDSLRVSVSCKVSVHVLDIDHPWRLPRFAQASVSQSKLLGQQVIPALQIVSGCFINMSPSMVSF